MRPMYPLRFRSGDAIAAMVRDPTAKSGRPEAHASDGHRAVDERVVHHVRHLLSVHGGCSGADRDHQSYSLDEKESDSSATRCPL